MTYTTHDSPDQIDFAELRRRSPGAYIGNNELSVEDAERMLKEDAAGFTGRSPGWGRRHL